MTEPQPVGWIGGDDVGQARNAMDLWRHAVARSKRECQERRARVLAHPDLAGQLRDRPLSLGDPAHWNGYIPPRMLPEETCRSCDGGRSGNGCGGWPHAARANDSPVRRQLVDIAAEAYARDHPDNP